MNRTERILEILDQGVGTSSEPSYAQVCPDRCTRCVRRDPVDGSDFCEQCRSFLLGDGPDPVDESPRSGWRLLRGLVQLPIIDPLLAEWDRLAQEHARAMEDRYWLEVRERPDMHAVCSVHPHQLESGGWHFLWVVVERMLQLHCHERRPTFVTLGVEDGLQAAHVRIVATWHSADPGLLRPDGVATPDYSRWLDPVFFT